MASHSITIRIPDALHARLLERLEHIRLEMPKGEPTKTWLAQRLLIEQLEQEAGPEGVRSDTELNERVEGVESKLDALRADLGLTLRALLGALIEDASEAKKATEFLDQYFPRQERSFLESERPPC